MVWRPPVLLAPLPPSADDPAVAAILRGLLQATGATGCRLSLNLLPDGPEADYQVGPPSASAPLVIRLESAESFRGILRLFDTGARPAASPAALECLRPMIEGALHALIERSNASRQIDILVQILGVADEAHLLMDERGEIFFANARGEEILALHTEQPQARLAGGAAAPLLSLIVAEIGVLAASGERVRRQALTTGDGGRWRLEIVGLAGLGGAGYSLVVLSPIRLLQPEEIRHRCSEVQVSPREAEVLAFLLRGQKASEIAARLGITEYTVKDHLKHAYAKLGITSRGQLLSRLEATAPGAS